jgi:hypothetical protein
MFDSVEYVLDSISEPLYDLQTHLYWKQAFTIYSRIMEGSGGIVEPHIKDKNEFMKKDFLKLYNSLK